MLAPFLSRLIDSGMGTQPKWSKETLSQVLLELYRRRSFFPNEITSYRDDTDLESCWWPSVSHTWEEPS